MTEDRKLPAGTVLTMRDIQNAGFCSQGTKSFCESYGLDFRKLLREGLPLEVFEATGDACIDRIKKVKLEREAGNG